MSDDKPTLKDRNHPARKLGRVLAQAGLTVLGAKVAGPGGAAFARNIGRSLGLPDVGGKSEEELNAEIEKQIATDPDALVALRQIQLDTVIADNELQASLAQSDANKLESVNETMRVEAAGVLTNPEAGAWRPMWGRWTCRLFFFTVVALLVAILVCIVTDRLDYLALMPMIIGALVGLFTLPAAILGVASYKRGEEKKELAKGLSLYLAAQENKPMARAVPIESREPGDGIFREDR